MPHQRRQNQRARVIGVAGTLVVALTLLLWWRRDRPHTTCCPGAGPAALNDSIAWDPSVSSDTLANGLRYYVYPNRSTDGRVQLRLVVNAGSVLEDDDQRGLAHAVEHMVLRGTHQFPGGAIERYLESLGMRRGEGVNATTSLDETVYRMTVPTDRPGAVDTALAMLASIAYDATFDGQHDSSEAGILLEEWRSQRDAFQRITDARRALIFAGTPYATRPAIGDTSVLRRFDIHAMRRFYEAWYRPERMAVVAVGDLDREEMERAVAKHFRTIPKRTGPPRPVTAPGLTTMSEPFRASVVSDPEATSTWIGFWYPRPNVWLRRRSDYRAALVASLWRSVLRARLEDASESPGSPIVTASVDHRYLARSLGAEVVSAAAIKNRALDAVQTMAIEMTRLARYGPTRREMDERATALVRQARNAAQSPDASTDVAAELVDHFLVGDAPVSNRAAYELTRDILPTIRAEDVTRFARGVSIDSGAIVIAAATSDDSIANVRPDELITQTRTAIGRPLGPVSEQPDVRTLITNEPVPGRVVAERAVSEVAAYDWTLSNGMRVILKPTAFTFDDIQLRLVAPGGASLASDDDYPSAYLADAVIRETGVGRLSGARLERWLASTSISMAPTVSDDAITIIGSTTPSDLDAFFQLLHLYLTSPRSDTVAFGRYRDRALSLLRDRDRDPDVVFRETLAAALGGGEPRATWHNARFYERANMTTALDFWTRRVSNAAGFTVVLAGDFTLDRVRPLVARYLASLPGGTRERPRDVGRPAVTGAVNRNVDAGVAGTARTAIAFTGPFDITNDALNALGAVRDVVAQSLQDRLREQLGGTYGVNVQLEVDVVPPARWTIAIDYSAAPERIESLTTAAEAELARLRTNGPNADEFATARAARVRDYDGQIDHNDFWTSELSFHARFGWPLATIAEHPRQAERLTLAELRAACATYIPDGRFVRVTMRPRAASAAGSIP